MKKFDKKLLWYSIPILIGGFLIYKQFNRGKQRGQDVPQPPQPPAPDRTGSGSGSGSGSGASSTYPLRKGSKNSQVSSLQSLLNTALSCQGKTLLVVDGDFGTKTETALSDLTGKKSVANANDFEAIKKQLASVCVESKNLGWAWKLIDAQNTGRYTHLVVTRPIKIRKVMKDFRGLWIPAVPAFTLNMPAIKYSLKDYVLRSATTDGQLRIEVMRGEGAAGMYITEDGTDLTTLNIT